MRKSEKAAPAEGALDDAEAAQARAREVEKEFGWVIEFVKGLASDCGRYVMAPRVLAERRRRKGDPHASPKDYECCCPLSQVDELPLCLNRRENCKFAHRPRPAGMPWEGDGVLFTVHRAEQRKIIDRFRASEPDEAIAYILSIEREVNAAFRRIEAATGIRKTRNTTGWE